MTATLDVAPPEVNDAGMTHRQVLEAMSGLMLGMFVAILSSTVVSTALPRIISDLGGSQSSYTWVVTSTLLALTVSTPVWGKLADLFDRKLLIQTGLGIYIAGSMLAGLSGRRYESALEPVGETVETAASGTSQSSVSRRFTTATAAVYRRERPRSDRGFAAGGCALT